MNGSLIKERLLELELSDAQFAVDLECSTSTVQNMKAGKRINERLLRRVAKRLGVSIEALQGSSASAASRTATG